MQETNKPNPSENLSPIVQEAVKMGYRPGTAAEESRKLDEFRNSLPGKELDAELRAVSDRSQRRGSRWGTRVAAGAIATVSLLGVANKLNDSEAIKDEPKATYVVGSDRDIDTPWEVAQSIQDKINATPSQESIGDIRPIVDDINEQSKLDGQPGLQIGEKIEVPAAADRSRDEGIQLSSK